MSVNKSLNNQQDESLLYNSHNNMDINFENESLNKSYKGINNNLNNYLTNNQINSNTERKKDLRNFLPKQMNNISNIPKTSELELDRETPISHIDYQLKSMIHSQSNRDVNKFRQDELEKLDKLTINTNKINNPNFNEKKSNIQNPYLKK